MRHRALIIARGRIASLLAESAREAEALSILDDNVATMRALSRANADQPAWTVDVAVQLRRRGEVLLRMGRHVDAEVAAASAIDVLQGLREADDSSVSSQRELMWSLLLFGDAASSVGRLDDA